jgi:uncharacterized protein with FMN-binding domain
MRRGIATIIGTAVGTVLLIGAKYGTHTGAGAPVAVDEPAQPVAAPVATTPAAARAKKTARSSSAKPPASPTPPRSGLKDGTYRGSGGQEAYGTIFVTITVQSGHVTNASATCTGCEGRSVTISNGAYPTLRQETLAKQSANIATVSGATETSNGYRASLRSALEAAQP